MSRLFAITDQPRGRGEHLHTRLCGRLRSGSAPRTRGTRVRRGSTWDTYRISPADAGNTRSCHHSPAAKADQPRGRGEHFIGAVLFDELPGSAPRTRGTRYLRTAPRWPKRISPADAGNTKTSRLCRSGTADQPRGRGEHTGAGVGDVDVAGSAPRTRGTLVSGRREVVALRISPADAGNTSAVLRGVL